jgi:hypothetical protein
MTVIKNKVGTLKTFTITPATPRETLLGSPLTLPTTEPTTAQVSFTIQQSDLPVFTPNITFKNNVSVICSGKAVTAATISYRVLKNGVSVTTAAATATPANNFWCHTYWAAWDAQVGDTIDIKLWSSQADSYVDFYGLICGHTQPDFSKRGNILKDLSFPSYATTTNLFSNTLVVSNGAAIVMLPVSNNSSANFSLASTHVFNVISPYTGGGLYKANVGEGGTSTYVQNNAGQRSYQRVLHPLTLQFREVNL